MKTLNKILNQYNISEIAPIELIRESSDNIVYLVGEKNKKILRVSKRLPIEDAQFEYEVSQHLAKNNFPVAQWIKTKDENFYASTEKIKVAIMFEFLEGYHAHVDKSNLPTKDQTYAAGRALACMHEIGKTFKPTSSRSRNVFIETERVLQNEDIFKKDFEDGEVFIEQVKEVIRFGKENKSLIGLIHNDYRTGNVFFKSDTEISGVIDFDWSCIGPIMKDIALGVLEWSCPDGRTEPDFTIFDAFLDGYNSVSIQKYAKNEELYSWIMFAALSDASTFFCDRLSSPDLKRKITSSYMYLKYLYFSKL
jgi:Ser/Thr protein kinase RdoA (MazF antagonist)